LWRSIPTVSGSIIILAHNECLFVIFSGCYVSIRNSRISGESVIHSVVARSRWNRSFLRLRRLCYNYSLLFKWFCRNEWFSMVVLPRSRRMVLMSTRIMAWGWTNNGRASLIISRSTQTMGVDMVVTRTRTQIQSLLFLLFREFYTFTSFS